MDTKGMSLAERNEYWEMVLEDYESSGLGRNEYCVRNDISIKTFRYWENKFKKESNDSVAFAEVSLKRAAANCKKVSIDATCPNPGSFNTELVIGCGSYTLSINSSTPMELVNKVLKEVSNA